MLDADHDFQSKLLAVRFSRQEVRPKDIADWIVTLNSTSERVAFITAIEERMCIYCGDLNPRCQCMNKE